MSFQKYTPRKSDCSPPSTEPRAKDIVQSPDKETTEKHGYSIDNHEPHGVQYLQVPLVFVMLPFLRRDGESFLFSSQSILLARVSPFRTERFLHGVHAPQDHNCSQYGVCILMENGVLEVVVVESDEDGQAG